jgi:hypothetical protein
VEHLKEPLTPQTGLLSLEVALKYISVTKFLAMILANLVTPKAADKIELLFNKPASG